MKIRWARIGTMTDQTSASAPAIAPMAVTTIERAGGCKHEQSSQDEYASADEQEQPKEQIPPVSVGDVHDPANHPRGDVADAENECRAQAQLS